jgi:hypothetical protein
MLTKKYRKATAPAIAAGLAKAPQSWEAAAAFGKPLRDERCAVRVGRSNAVHVARDLLDLTVGIRRPQRPQNR